jgi:hypothetical protein
LKYQCKVWPGSSQSAFPKEAFHWAPVINVKLIHRHSPPTKYIEAWLDTGAHCCMFHASFCRALGIRLEDGIKSELSGVISGDNRPMYFHKTNILIGSSKIETMVDFCESLSVGGLLGRRGFFDHFVFILNGTGNPPAFELEKINRI